MTTSELKKIYTIEDFITTEECEGKVGARWYVLPGEMTAIDAVKMVADKLHVSKDNIVESRGYVCNNKLYLRKSWEKKPNGTKDVWALVVR